MGRDQTEGAGSWLLYGANGYTGSRAAAAAKAQGMRPVLAGRNLSAIKGLADGLDLPWKAFNLDDETATRQTLADVDVVAHCAGPFSATSAPMVSAC